MHLGSGRGQHYDLKGLHKRRKRVMVSSRYWGSLRSSCAVLGFFFEGYSYLCLFLIPEQLGENL